MKKADYEGALNLRNISRVVKTPLDYITPYKCPAGHTEYKETCPSCKAIYGEYKRKYNH